MKNAIELKTPEDVRWYWTWKSSMSTCTLSNGKTYGLQKPRCECTVRIGK